MKKWYNKKRLERYKELVESGYVTSEEYNDFKNKMETFDLDENEIVLTVMDYFKEVEFDKEVCFTQILSWALKLNSLAFFSDSTLLNLYNKFLKECKKENIKIVFQSYGDPVGIPYNLGFWKTEKVEIKKIVYNKFYGCWGIDTELNREYVIFTEDRVTYCRVPLSSCASKNNCSIKISFDPCEIVPPGVEPDENAYNFIKIAEMAEIIGLNHRINYNVCDAIPASIDVYYDNGKKKSYFGLSSEETQFIADIAKRLTPNAYIFATHDIKERNKYD